MALYPTSNVELHSVNITLHTINNVVLHPVNNVVTSLLIYLSYNYWLIRLNNYFNKILALPTTLATHLRTYGKQALS